MDSIFFITYYYLLFYYWLFIYRLYGMKCLLMTCLDIKHSESLTYIIDEPPTKWPFQL